MNKALIVDDEKNLAATLKLSLESMGITTEVAYNLKEARAAMKNKYQLVLLDRNLPDGDGLELCDEFRKENPESIILFLSVLGDIDNRVLGLKKGADDYLAKPFSLDELTLKVKNLLNRVSPKSKGVWDLDSNRLTVTGPLGSVQLTKLEFELVACLVSHPGKVYSRNDLLKKVWGFSLVPRTRTVDHFMGRLRKLFESDPENPKHFKTMRGMGYYFEI